MYHISIVHELFHKTLVLKLVPPITTRELAVIMHSRGLVYNTCASIYDLQDSPPARVPFPT